MYVAQRELKIVKKGTEKTLFYKPGDHIPDFEDWDIHAKRAHLNLEWVTKIEDEAKQAASSVKKPKKSPKKGAKKADEKLAQK